MKAGKRVDVTKPLPGRRYTGYFNTIRIDWFWFYIPGSSCVSWSIVTVPNV